MRRLALFGVFFVLAGCAASPPVQRTAIYNPAEYAPYAKAGDGRIVGQAFLKTVGGEVRYGAGNSVFLHPVTSSTAEWFNKMVVQGLPLAQGDPRSDRYAVQTVANGEGRFAFEHLPPGDYYLTCNIVWGLPDGSETGGIAYAKVTVPPHGAVGVVVTRPSLP